MALGHKLVNCEQAGGSAMHIIMRSIVGIAGALLLLLLTVASSRADRRVALVIGNGDYERADKLANPVTDAQRMRDVLSQIGFEVVYGENLAKQPLERTIGRFANEVQDANVALVYFAGHGATFGDVPYVVPVDAQFSTLAEIPYELVPLETLISELRRAKGVRIAILDACRDDTAERELKRVSARGGEVTRGLGRVRNPEGLILAYATQYLSTAADGDPSGDSPFTTALLNHIATPGLDVKELFYRVGNDVIAATNGKQRPEIGVSFFDSYALVPGSSGPVVAHAVPVPVAEPPPSPPRAPVIPGFDPRALELSYWESVRNSTSPAMVQTYLDKYPNGIFANLAKARIQELRDAHSTPPSPPAPPRRAPDVVASVPPPSQPTLLERISKGHWCTTARSYSLNLRGDNVTWTDSVGNVDVEDIMSNANDEAHTRTRRSSHRDNKNVPIGTTWSYSMTGRDSVRVRSSKGSEFRLTKC
jgi:hypothetical protein